MKIVGSQLPAPAVQRVSSATGNATASASSASSSASSSAAATEASVVVSTSAGSASAAQAKCDHAIDQRIEVLRTSIGAGEYKPDLDRLASRMVDEERSLAVGSGHERR